MRHQDPHGPLAHGIRLQGRESTGIAVDPVRGQSVRLRAGGEKEMTLRVQAEGAGPIFGCYVPDGRQPTGGGVDCEARDAVVASVGSVQEFPGGRNLNLGAGVAFLVTGGQGGDGLEGAQGAVGGVDVVPGDARALLVGEIEQVLAGMEAEVAGAPPPRLAPPGGGVWGHGSREGGGTLTWKRR